MSDEFRGADRPQRALLIVFVLSFCTLMFELVLSRMSVFYLNYANSFLAIPLTLFGLAVGSLRVHLGKRAPEEIDIRRDLLALIAASFLAFALAFAIYSQFFPITFKTKLASPLQVVKTVMFVVVFMPPFFFVGKILTTLYARNRTIIGKLYGWDLFGAAAACFVTPLFFHVMDLPYIIAVCLVSMTILCAITFGRGGWRTAAVLFAVNLVMLPTLVFLEGRYDMSQVLGKGKAAKIEEVVHRWNEYSRVSLLRAEKADGDLDFYRIIHDNAESYVYVREYYPKGHDKGYISPNARIPLILGRPADELLVMFAGCGAQNIEFDAAGMGKTRNVGVEINQLVMDFALKTPELKRFHIREFFRTPHAKMFVMEGRRFLDTHDQPFDVIYVANNAATSQYKSGHSRKYLDTKEAMAAYLDRLRDPGLIIFRCQAIEHQVDIFKALFQERGIGALADHAMVLRHPKGFCNDLIVSKQSLTEQDTEAMREAFKRNLVYAPGTTQGGWAARLTSPVLTADEIVTDDRPYIEKLDFARFKLLPEKRLLADRLYYRSWIKIATMVFVGLLLFGVVVGVYMTKAAMPPPTMMVYLLLTGFCYMLVEIAFIGKLDLFLENPLYSMALLLSLFLLTNAFGANLYHRFGKRIPMAIMPLVVAVVVGACLRLADMMIAGRLGVPLPVKIALTALVMAPVGTGLGLFYPFVVSWLTEHGHDKAVPITYGVSTLSSVAGATYAMTMVINVGYTNIVYQSIVGYGVLAVFMAAIGARLLRKA